MNKPINLNRFNGVSECNKHFIKNGFNEVDGALTKKISSNEQIKFNCYSENLQYEYHYETTKLRIKSFNCNYKENSDMSTIKFDIYDRENNIRGSLIYDFYRKKITGREEMMKYTNYVEHAIELFETYKTKGAE